MKVQLEVEVDTAGSDPVAILILEGTNDGQHYARDIKEDAAVCYPEPQNVPTVGVESQRDQLGQTVRIPEFLLRVSHRLVDAVPHEFELGLVPGLATSTESIAFERDGVGVENFKRTVRKRAHFWFGFGLLCL